MLGAYGRNKRVKSEFLVSLASEFGDGGPQETRYHLATIVLLQREVDL